MSEVKDRRNDMSLREASDWAGQQAKRIAANFGMDMAADRDKFALAQTAKLGEEVGELHAEVLGAIRYCRQDKAAQFTSDSLVGELADVMVCTLLLAEIFQVDLPAALTDKIDFLRERQF
jgi:NTP pyrophosphatase (non-canonical NTP hydrolase)